MPHSLWDTTLQEFESVDDFMASSETLVVLETTLHRPVTFEPLHWKSPGALRQGPYRDREA
jgi:hypothetical protein